MWNRAKQGPKPTFICAVYNRLKQLAEKSRNSNKWMEIIPQRLKATLIFAAVRARLKPCPSHQSSLRDSLSPRTYPPLKWRANIGRRFATYSGLKPQSVAAPAPKHYCAVTQGEALLYLTAVRLKPDLPPGLKPRRPVRRFRHD